MYSAHIYIFTYIHTHCTNTIWTDTHLCIFTHTFHWPPCVSNTPTKVKGLGKSIKPKQAEVYHHYDWRWCRCLPRPVMWCKDMHCASLCGICVLYLQHTCTHIHIRLHKSQGRHLGWSLYIRSRGFGGEAKGMVLHLCTCALRVQGYCRHVIS